MNIGHKVSARTHGGWRRLHATGLVWLMIPYLVPRMSGLLLSLFCVAGVRSAAVKMVCQAEDKLNMFGRKKPRPQSSAGGGLGAKRPRFTASALATHKAPAD